METHKEVATLIMKIISNKQVNIKSAIDLLKLVMTQVEKIKGLKGKEKALMVALVIEEVAKGKDGVAGTDDDLISPFVMKGIKALIENNLIGSTVEVIIDASKGHIEINKVKNCFSSIFGCIRSMK